MSLYPNFSMLDELSILHSPTGATRELKTFEGNMNPSIMRVLINVYEANKSKGLSDDELYALLVNKWGETLGMPPPIVLPQTEIDKEEGGFCSGSSKREVRSETPTKKEEGGSSCDSRSKSDRRWVSLELDKGLYTETPTKKEEGGGCGGSSKREVCSRHGTEGDKNIGSCSCSCGPLKRIFMVDDSLVSCKLSTKVLESCAHTLTMCTSGSEAINILAKASADCENAIEVPFDILFLDIVMPEIDGIQVLGHIKSLPNLSNIPVVMLSALEDGDLAEKCLEIGAIEVLQKPLKCADVKALLAKLKQFGKKFKKESLISLSPCHPLPAPSRSLTKASSKAISCTSSTFSPSPYSSSPHATNYYNSSSTGTDKNFGDSPNMLEPPSNLEVGSSAPIASIMLCNRKGRMVRAIPKARVSVILLLPGRCASKSGSINDLVFTVMDVAREQGRVGDVVSLIFITPEEDNVVLPGEIYKYSFASRVTVDDATWKAFLGVTHTFTSGLLIVDGEGTTVFSWSDLVDHDGNLHNPENCVSKDELMAAVHRAVRRTLLGTSATQRVKQKAPRSHESPSFDTLSTGATKHEWNSFERSKSCDGMEIKNSCMLNILVVDDSLMSCKLSVRKLQSLGFLAEYVSNGTAAIEMLRKRPTDFHLVLLDIVMPDVDGMEVLSQIRSDSAICDVPVIMLSGLVENEALTKRLVDSGASGVLCKPLDEAEVANLSCLTNTIHFHVNPNPFECNIDEKAPNQDTIFQKGINTKIQDNERIVNNM